MTRDPTVVRDEDRAEPLLARLEGQHLDAAPVVDPDGQLLGVVTRRSLQRLLRSGSAIETTDRGGARNLLVRDVMDTRTVWVEPSDDLDTVVRQMTRYRVRSMPVVERSGSRRRLVGMVSRADLLRGAKPPRSAQEDSVR